MALPELAHAIRKRDPDNDMGSDAEVWNSVWAPKPNTNARSQSTRPTWDPDEPSLDDVFNDAPAPRHAGRRSQHD